MAASDHLNGLLFHGTAHQFKEGDVILPASKAGVKSNWGAKSKNNPNFAHATENLESARYFASVASIGKEGAVPRVYQVEPVNPETAQWHEKRFAGGKGGYSTYREHISPDGYKVLREYPAD